MAMFSAVILAGGSASRMNPGKVRRKNRKAGCKRES